VIWIVKYSFRLAAGMVQKVLQNAPYSEAEFKNLLEREL